MQYKSGNSLEGEYGRTPNRGGAFSGGRAGGALQRSTSPKQSPFRSSAASPSSGFRKPGGPSGRPGSFRGVGNRFWGSRRWGWLYPGSYSGPINQDILQAQQCLAQTVGAWVPTQGVMGPATRRAIRIFQKRQGLPVTAMLDLSTTSALQNACSGAQEPAAPPSDSSSTEDNGGNPADASPSPAEGAAPDTGSPDSDAGEISFLNEEQTGEQEELLVDGRCRIALTYHPAVPLNNTADLQKISNEPGVYMIYSDGKPWYVGVATNHIRDRFMERRKAIHDFNIPPEILKGRSVAFATLNSRAAASCTVLRREAGTTKAGTPIKDINGALLKIAEQFYIRRLGTKAEGKGNKTGERVIVEGNKPMTFVITNEKTKSTETHDFRPGNVALGAT